MSLAEGTQQFCAFSTKRGLQVTASGSETQRKDNHDFLEYVLFPAPDLNSDGVSDFLAMITPLGYDELGAYSGKTLQPLWKVAGAVDAGTAAAAFLYDSKVLRMLALGRVQAQETPGGYGKNGEVVLLDPSSGIEIKRLHDCSR
ncbi:MAG TPA: hypothetical protein VK843_21915 [Planctomycetota bacterium]|nr:hypothetical protein [Planctomycetota bacterium]